MGDKKQRIDEITTKIEVLANEAWDLLSEDEKQMSGPTMAAFEEAIADFSIGLQLGLPEEPDSKEI
jgi:hypothetical protein